jgi:hypothetical protein
MPKKCLFLTREIDDDIIYMNKQLNLREATMKNRFLIISLLGLLTSCATVLTPGGRSMREAEAKGVENCEYLGDLHAASGHTMSGVEGIENARNMVRNQAAEKGATHIVWTAYSPVGAYLAGTVWVKAYRCK